MICGWKFLEKETRGMAKNLENMYGVYIVPLCKGLNVHKCLASY
jgi:hypothetical protein